MDTATSDDFKRKRKEMPGTMRARAILVGGVGMGLLGLTFSVDPKDCGEDSIHFCLAGRRDGAAEVALSFAF